MSNTINALVVIFALVGLTVADDTEIRGITISTHGIGRDWGTDAIVPTLEDIRAVGANWVAIHPYASIRADGSLRWSDIDPDDPPAHIVRPIREAHRLGLRIYIKPHIAYWRSPFSWRGENYFYPRRGLAAVLAGLLGVDRAVGDCLSGSRRLCRRHRARPHADL